MTIDELLPTAIPLLVLGALLAGIGQAIGMTLGDSREGWRGIWHQTRALHPILAGLAMGFSSLPVPAAMGEGLAGRLVWFGLAGAFAVPCYEIVRRAIERRAP